MRTFSSFSSWPIRVHMYLLVLLLALPAVAVIIHSGIRYREEAIGDANARAEKLAYTISSELTLLVDNTRQLSMNLAHLPEVRSRNAVALNPLLKELLQQYPYYATIFVTDRNGMVWASSRPASTGHSVADRRYFKDAVATGQFSAGEFAIGKASGLPTISFSYPLKGNSGGISGVIVVSLDLHETARLFVRAKLPADATYGIFDYKGTFLYRSSDSDKFVGTQDRLDILKRVQNGRDEGQFEVYSNDNLYRLVAYRKLRLFDDQSPYMYVRAGIPLNAATKAASRALFSDLMLFAPFLLAALAMGWFVSKRCVVDRVYALQAAGRSLAAGNLGTRVAIRDRGGELGELADTFDSMAHSLQAHEKELREKSELLHAVIEGTTDAIYVKDPAGRYLLFNSGAAVMTGKSAEEVLGRDDKLLFPPELAQIMMEKDRSLLENGEMVVCEEVIEGSGTMHIVLTTKGVLREHDGKITGLFGISRDITRRKRAEMLLQEAHDDLELRVEARTGELAATVEVLKGQIADRKKAEERLKQETAQRLLALEQLRENERSMIQQSRLAAMGEMISNIAHQWRQPLNTLGMLIQRLQLVHEMGVFTAEVLNNSTRESMQLINHMSGTIDVFSNFFKPDKDMVTFNVNETILQTVSLVEANFRQQQIRLTILSEGVPEIKGYPNEYSQVLLNILLNARDVFAERSIDEAHITVQSFLNGDAAVVTIEDSAGGIPEDIMGKIFDPHFTTKGPQGSGIGLFMAKNIIERNMNGRLSVRNTEVGAEFRIEI